MCRKFSECYVGSPCPALLAWPYIGLRASQPAVTDGLNDYCEAEMMFAVTQLSNGGMRLGDQFARPVDWLNRGLPTAKLVHGVRSSGVS